MMSKLKFIIPVVLLLVGGGVFYKVKIQKPPPKPKVEGEVYVLPKDFTINLSEGRFAKLGVGMVFHHGYTAAAGGHEGSTPPEGYGALPQEAIVRDIVSDTLTGQKADELIDVKGREKLKKEVLHRIEEHTDVKAEEVLFTDLSVQ